MTAAGCTGIEYILVVGLALYTILRSTDSVPCADVPARSYRNDSPCQHLHVSYRDLGFSATPCHHSRILWE